jgi:mono/diheme cytochrome c family protein
MMKRMRGCAGVTIVLGSVLWLMPTVSAQEAAAPDKGQDLAKIAAGENVYNTYCAVCHGDGLVSTGQFPNLRRLTANARAKFDDTVHNGKNQMPPWKDVLSDAQIDQLWHYIRANAYDK